jgi:hypothetical protein
MRLIASSMLSLVCIFAGAVHASTTSEPKISLSGIVQVRSEPVLGTHVYLLETTDGPKGSASGSLLNGAVTKHADQVGAYVLSNQDGTFAMPSLLACTPESILYIYTWGGNLPGHEGNNPHITLMAIVGSCGKNGVISLLPQGVLVNEYTTMRTAYAFKDLAIDPTHISSIR